MTLEFTREPQDVVAVRSKSVVLQCAVSSSVPGPVNISWTHDDRILPLVNDTRRYLLPNGSLYFKKVSNCALRVSAGQRMSVFIILLTLTRFECDSVSKRGRTLWNGRYAVLMSALRLAVPHYRLSASGFVHSMSGFCFRIYTLYKVVSSYMFGDTEVNHDNYVSR